MQEEYNKLVTKLINWAKAYYVDDIPVATDIEYDELYHKVLDLETKNEITLNHNSPTQKVGGKVSTKFNKYQFDNRMWSQEDIFNNDELNKWLNRIPVEASLIMEPKYDGLSLKLLYVNRVLKHAITRGDGLVGEDVTVNARTIKTIPLTLPDTAPDILEINGEVCMKYNDFDKLNEDRALKDKKLFANPRNAAAGSMRLLDSKEVSKRKLTFYPWELVNYHDLSSEYNSKWKAMKYVYELGFKRPKHKFRLTNHSKVQECYDRMLSTRDEHDVGIDGIVIKIEDSTIAEELGFTNKFPKWSVAYKFPAVEKVTVIKDIKLQVGRLGTITPVAEVTPIDLDGSMVSNATLSNFEDIARKDIRINDEVTIIKSGDIIPKIISVFKDRRDVNSKPYEAPTHCPTCNTLLVKDNSYLRCPNEQCVDRVAETIKMFVDREHMNIQGFGDSVIRHLIEVRLISNPSDIYTLSLHNLETKTMFGDKTRANLLKSIPMSFGKELWLLIGSIGIPEVGRTISKTIYKVLGKDMIYADKETLLSIKGVGEKIAVNLSEYTSKNKEYLERLIMLSNVITSEPIKTNGITVCISGSFTRDGKKLDRKELSEILEEDGFTVVSKMTKGVDCLIAGLKTGESKMSFAEKNKIPTLYVTTDVNIPTMVESIKRITK